LVQNEIWECAGVGISFEAVRRKKQNGEGGAGIYLGVFLELIKDNLNCTCKNVTANYSRIKMGI
jgi:hypothetical protein